MPNLHDGALRRFEIIGRALLISPADRSRSELTVRLGYGLAPNTRPAASAKLEWRIAPNL
ncbi:hypothetical protein BB934_14580 [Microvirga ossetica]|uniref:Uncharacterized protein n=1 Tax=Microvirga ossetica TaxID=1882682 RepID=A0A1B2EH36_9HYPH|nr:hypothetical protein [Microvirga ossetica]ANY79291.1 hypothetical protein BB934_14580 [Microvirga ossetica]